MTPEHLRAAAQALVDGNDAVFLPAEDGGYALIGLNAPAVAELFDGIAWGTSEVMAATRLRLSMLGYSWTEPTTVWDIDTPSDLARWQASYKPRGRKPRNAPGRSGQVHGDLKGHWPVREPTPAD